MYCSYPIIQWLWLWIKSTGLNVSVKLDLSNGIWKLLAALFHQLNVSGGNHSLKNIRKVEESMQKEYDTHIKAVSKKHNLMCTTDKNTWAKYFGLSAEYDEEAKLALVDEVLNKQVRLFALLLLHIKLHSSLSYLLAVML